MNVLSIILPGLTCTLFDFLHVLVRAASFDNDLLIFDIFNFWQVNVNLYRVSAHFKRYIGLIRPTYKIKPQSIGRLRILGVVFKYFRDLVMLLFLIRQENFFLLIPLFYKFSLFKFSFLAII